MEDTRKKMLDAGCWMLDAPIRELCRCKVKGWVSDPIIQDLASRVLSGDMVYKKV